jgi:ankyrin repeat protein
MKMQVRKRYTVPVSVLLVLGGLSLACFLWVKNEQRQVQRNRALIDSLAKGDFKRALALVEAGADPNTRVKPQPLPTWQELLKRMISRSTPSSNRSPTAFMVTFGEYYPEHSGEHYIPPDRMRDPRLTELKQRMLVHGANVDARDEDGATILMRASYSGHTEHMAFLLEHGAAIGALDNKGGTALHDAAVSEKPDAVSMLLKYHANPNVKDRYGNTPLRDASTLGRALQSNYNNPSPSKVIRLLKAAGATE